MVNGKDCLVDRGSTHRHSGNLVRHYRCKSHLSLSLKLKGENVAVSKANGLGCSWGIGNSPVLNSALRTLLRKHHYLLSGPAVLPPAGRGSTCPGHLGSNREFSKYRPLLSVTKAFKTAPKLSHLPSPVCPTACARTFVPKLLRISQHLSSLCTLDLPQAGAVAPASFRSCGLR